MKPTQEQVVQWAREAGFITKGVQEYVFPPSELHITDQLKTAFTFAYEAGRESTKLDSIHICHDQCQRPACIAVREAYKAGRKDENEECGKICDAAQLFGNSDERWAAKCCADQIRARREQ